MVNASVELIADLDVFYYLGALLALAILAARLGNVEVTACLRGHGQAQWHGRVLSRELASGPVGRSSRTAASQIRLERVHHCRAHRNLAVLVLKIVKTFINFYKKIFFFNKLTHFDCGQYVLLDHVLQLWPIDV